MCARNVPHWQRHRHTGSQRREMPSQAKTVRKQAAVDKSISDTANCKPKRVIFFLKSH